MTAVELLVKEFSKHYAIHQLEDEIKQAKQLEKQQIIDAFSKGVDDGFYGFGDRSEQYYNETYKQ